MRMEKTFFLKKKKENETLETVPHGGGEGPCGGRLHRTKHLVTDGGEAVVQLCGGRVGDGRGVDGVPRPVRRQPQVHQLWPGGPAHPNKRLFF